ncbi:MAG: hypothetical protein VW518_01220 [Burkholderiaceae bacterium]
MADNEEWSEIDVSPRGEEKPKVEYEIEGQEEEQEEAVEAAPVKEDRLEDVQEKEEKQPEELEGIETKGAQKRIKQLIKQRKEREDEIAQLRAEVENLRSSVKERDKNLSSSVKINIDSTDSQLDTRIEQAREIFKQAADSGDTERMLLAQEEMSKAYAEKTSINQQRRAWEEYNAQLEAMNMTPQQHVAPIPQYDPKAVEWAGRNSWFGQDQIKTAAALQIDAELKDQGYDPSDDDFYAEVDHRLRTKFPDLAPAVKEEPRLQNTPSNSAQVVAGASRTPRTSSNSNRVKLSQEDVQRAQKWGIPLEQYAAEKLKAEKADGEYTEII